MKKIFAFLTIAVLFASAQAQNNIPRTGNAPNQDNTYRVLNYAYDSVPKDATGLDTISVVPFAYHTQVYVGTVRDSFAFNIPTIANSYKGDELEIQVLNSSTGKVIRWAGPYWQTATVTAGSAGGAMYLTASKRATIIFHFDGNYWVEVSRLMQ